MHTLPYAIIDILKSLRDIGKWLALAHTPGQVFDFPVDFIGVNVAPGKDATVDDYILAHLAELGISHVRMDFTYSSVNGPAQRLLNALLENGYQVLLDVFPHLEQAKTLYKNSDAQTQWADFLNDIFQCYQGKVACFEIGATPNRGKWSGFSSRSFLAAWNIASNVASNYPVRLAGPNVSDFEPLFNATYLSLLQRQKSTPEVHTDNLFMERVIEPEAYDHRVFGRGAAKRLKLNLIKKARILHLIGRDRGCTETWCTYTCWTRKRLSRRGAWPENKAADYLLRYLTLAAASGSLNRVYWGPLICARDGLIHTQAESYPAIDQVSFYQSVQGKPNEFVTTPAYYTFKNCLSRLAGARCYNAIHEVDGASLFSFENNTGERFQLCWCRDGQSWPLTIFFNDEELASAQYYDTQGQAISAPLVICEHPVFIDIASLPKAHGGQLRAEPMHKAIRHLSSPDHQSAGYHDQQWRGAYMLRREHQHDDLDGASALYPDSLLKLDETAVLRDARNRIWNVADPRVETGQVTVKLNRTRGFKRFSYRFRPSKGRRHWNNACEMLRRGLSTPLPVAFHERLSQSGVRDSWYLCEYVPDAFSARDVYAALREGAASYKGLDKPAWFKLLSNFVCDMHNCQIVHRDLSAGNLLLRQNSDGSIQPMLIDIGRAWLGQGSGIKPRHRLLDLMRIAYKLDWGDREAFITAYEAYLERPLSPLWRISFHYYDAKQGLKKWLKRKQKKIIFG